MSSPYFVERMKQELNDPNSPYYLGRPTPIEFIQRNLSGYNTHYFGANKKTFLAQPQVDTVQLLRNAKENNIKNNWFKAVAITGLSLAGLIICRKIPVLNLLPKAVGGIISSIGGFFK